MSTDNVARIRQLPSEKESKPIWQQRKSSSTRWKNRQSMSWYPKCFSIVWGEATLSWLITLLLCSMSVIIVEVTIHTLESWNNFILIKKRKWERMRRWIDWRMMRDFLLWWDWQPHLCPSLTATTNSSQNSLRIYVLIWILTSATTLLEIKSPIKHKFSLKKSVSLKIQTKSIFPFC